MSVAARLFSVFAAAFLVVALSLAILFPIDQPLASLLDEARPGLANQIARSVGPASGALWTRVVQPTMVRPGWVIPIALGMVCGGMVLTLTVGARPNAKSTRRRG